MGKCSLVQNEGEEDLGEVEGLEPTLEDREEEEGLEDIPVADLVEEHGVEGG